MSFFCPSCCGKRVRDPFRLQPCSTAERVFTSANGMTLLKIILRICKVFSKTPPKMALLCPSMVRGRFPKRADKRSSRTEPRKTKMFFANRVPPRVTPENPSVFNTFRRFQLEKQKTCDPANPHENSLFDFGGCHPMTCSSRGDGCTIAATEGDGVPNG